MQSGQFFLQSLLLCMPKTLTILWLVILLLLLLFNSYLAYLYPSPLAIDCVRH